jgi:hypothetical protein
MSSPHRPPTTPSGQGLATFTLLALVIAAALLDLSLRVTPYMVPQVTTAPVPQTTRTTGGPAIQLLPLIPRGTHVAAPTVPPNPFGSAHFGPQVHTIAYRAVFRAYQALEGADGQLYLAYYWVPRGSIIYDPDRLGTVTGGIVREIIGFPSNAVSITGLGPYGYPVFTVGEGAEPGGDATQGTWVLGATGPVQVGRQEPPPFSAFSPALLSGGCADFAGGLLCERRGRVTYRIRGYPVVSLRGAHLIGAGRHRFLVSVFDKDGAAAWDLEGFAR